MVQTYSNAPRARQNLDTPSLVYNIRLSLITTRSSSLHTPHRCLCRWRGRAACAHHGRLVKSAGYEYEHLQMRETRNRFLRDKNTQKLQRHVGEIKDAKLRQIGAEIADIKLHQLGGEFPLPFALVPWRHHIEIITKCKSTDETLFYIGKTIEQGQLLCTGVA